MNGSANAVIYARYSSHNQTERSIEGQLQDCYEYAERCGFNVVGEYIDRAMTGTNDNRENFQKMIADAAKKQFQYIIVYKLDRFARNRYDSAIYKNKIKKYGVRVLSAMEQISDSPEGIILESVLEGMAEYYSANLSQNVKRGLRVAIQNKTYTGGIPPYGYKVVDRIVQPDEKTAPIAKWIFEQYANGVPKRKIIDELNNKGYKSKTGKQFTINSLQHVLNNKKYIGIHTFKGEEIEGIFPAIIDESTFNKVQQQLKRHKHAPAAQKARIEYLLQGKAFCGYCGSPMVGDAGTGKSGTRYYYYACSKYKKHVRECKKKREKKDFIEWYVVEQTLLYVLNPKQMNYLAERVVDVYNKDFNDEKIKELENSISAIDKEMDALIDLGLKSRTDAVVRKIDKRAEELDLQKQDLSIDLAKLRIANKIKLTKEDIIKWLKSFCEGDLFDMKFRRRIIDTFINSIYLFDDKVVIWYNLKDGKQVSYIETIDAIDEFSDLVFDEEDMNCSDFNPPSPPLGFKSEHRFIFANGLFGIVILRN